MKLRPSLSRYGTAHLALTRRARLARGETVLVTAAAGGVGIAAIQLANLLGARAVAACGSAEKLALCERYGASAPGVNYAAAAGDGRAFRAALQEAAGPRGVDVMLDMVGGELLEAGVRSLNWDGRAVVVGFAGGAVPKIPANLLLVKNVALTGVYWGAHLRHEPATLRASMAQLVEWWLAGELKPHVGARYPLAEAFDALTLVAERRSSGKVLLLP